MLSSEFYEKSKNVLNIISKSNYLNNTLSDLNDYYQDSLQTSLSQPKTLFFLFKYLMNQSKKQSLYQILNNIQSRLLFKDIESILNTLRATEFSDFVTTSENDKISSHLEKFANTFEEYIKNKEDNKTIHLLISAVELHNYLNGFIHGLQQFTKNYAPLLNKKLQEDELSIILSSNLTLSDFIIKLQSLEKIYEELCNLTNTSINDYPLQISKIESGSLWVKLFGNSKVIALLTESIKSAAQYIYRNSTNEGKMTTIPKKVETIDELLSLRTKLKQANIPTDNIDAEIEKASILIAKGMNNLLSNEYEITVNDTKISYHKIDGNHKEIEHKKVLPNKSNTENSD